jgi:hypothetical protein
MVEDLIAFFSSAIADQLSAITNSSLLANFDVDFHAVGAQALAGFFCRA